MKFFTYLLVQLVFPMVIFAQSGKIEFTEYTLDNGLHVILHEDHTVPIAVVSVMYHVGSKNEDPNRTGFAHFFEHLLFEGSENIGRGEFHTYINEAGGTNNANTTFDRTYYHENLPSNYLELGLWLESERMLHARVNQRGIEVQREVVKEEKRSTFDNQPYGSMLEEILVRSFREHPYRWTTIGSMEHLNAASEEDYIRFYEKFYVPNNAVLSIAGDIDIIETKMLIDKYFSTIPRGDEVAQPEIVEPPLGGEVRDTIYDQIQLPAVIQAYRIPAQGTDEFYAVDMLGRLLSQGESSRLSKKLVNETREALGVIAQPVPAEDPGLAITLAVANIGVDPGQMEATMNAEIERVRNELITEHELQKLKNQIEASFVSSNSTMAGVAESLANYHMYYGDANLVNTEIERYLEVSREDIREVARKYFSSDNRVVLFYLPQAN